MHTYLRNKPAWMQLIIFGGLTEWHPVYCFEVRIEHCARSESHEFHVKLLANLTPADFARPENCRNYQRAAGGSILRYLCCPHLFLLTWPIRIPALCRIKSSPETIFSVPRPDHHDRCLFSVELLGMLNESHRAYSSPVSTQKWVINGEDEANGMLENILP